MTENKGDLISREALKKALKSNCDTLCPDKNTNWCEHCCPLNDFEDLIDNAPTVEGEILTKEAYSNLCLRASRERPQGEWIKDEEHSITINMFRCSNCNGYGHTHFSYCPNCGASMKKGGEE